MQRRLVVLLAIAVLCLSVGLAGAAVPDGMAPTNNGQALIPLPAALIPKFVEPLPLLEFEFINATSLTLPGLLAPLGPGENGTPFNIDAEEFQAQILPTVGNPLIPVGTVWPPVGMCTNNTASWTFGYIGTATSQKPKDVVGGIHSTYLGPVVIAERGVPANPIYGNNLPLNGNVQTNLPIDRTLDWADPTGLTSPDLCLPDANGAYTNPTCGMLPYMGPMPIATHLHGGEVPPAFDGGPDAWFTQDLLGALVQATDPVTGAPLFDPVTGAPIMIDAPDGMPDVTGIGWPGAQYTYPNDQQAGTIWFHDHALGITRLNVYAGLAGIQPIIDPANEPMDPVTGLPVLPQLTDGFDVPLIIQDRSFDQNCDIHYALASNPQPNPTVHPFWIPEFIGDTIAVNGKTWPFFNVEPRQYRFRFVNGSNARFYELTMKSSDNLVTGTPGAKMPWLVVATDDGYLANAVAVNTLVIGPGERYEVVVDFKNLGGGAFPVTMFNSARTPYPGGLAVVKGLTDRVMQFKAAAMPYSTVPDTAVVAGTVLRDPVLNPIQPIAAAVVPPALPPAAPGGNIVRQLTLNEVLHPINGPLELVVNNSKFNLTGVITGCTTPLCRETEIPAVGDTEIWEIINISADAHPMHTHLTSFQVLSRQPFKAAAYVANYMGLPTFVDGMGPPLPYLVRNTDGAIGGNPAVGPFLKGKARGPEPFELGWKDTVIAYPGEVTRIAVRWGVTDLAPGMAGDPLAPVAYNPAGGIANNSYIFDPTVLAGGVGYVWHCHIVDHEDNEMMRNYVVGTARQPVL